MLNRNTSESQLCRSRKTRTLQVGPKSCDREPACRKALAGLRERQDATRPTCENTKWGISFLSQLFHSFPCESSLANRSINSYSQSRKQNGESSWRLFFLPCHLFFQLRLIIHHPKPSISPLLSNSVKSVKRKKALLSENCQVAGGRKHINIVLVSSYKQEAS